jgi:TolB-like protein
MRATAANGICWASINTSASNSKVKPASSPTQSGSQQDYFSDGITEDIITELCVARSAVLFVANIVFSQWATRRKWEGERRNNRSNIAGHTV